MNDFENGDKTQVQGETKSSEDVFGDIARTAWSNQSKESTGNGQSHEKRQVSEPEELVFETLPALSAQTEQSPAQHAAEQRPIEKPMPGPVEMPPEKPMVAKPVEKPLEQRFGEIHLPTGDSMTANGIALRASQGPGSFGDLRRLEFTTPDGTGVELRRFDITRNNDGSYVINGHDVSVQGAPTRRYVINPAGEVRSEATPQELHLAEQARLAQKPVEKPAPSGVVPESQRIPVHKMMDLLERMNRRY